MTDNKQTLNDLNLPTMSLIEKFCNTPEGVKIFFAEMLSVYENNPTPENLQLIAEKIKSRESREEKQAWLKEQTKNIDNKVKTATLEKYIKQKNPVPKGLPTSGELLSFLDYVPRQAKDEFMEVQAAGRILSHLENGNPDLKKTLVALDEQGKPKEAKDFLNKPFATEIQRMEQIADFLSAYKSNQTQIHINQRHEESLANLAGVEFTSPEVDIEKALEECKKMALQTLALSAQKLETSYPEASQKLSDLVASYGEYDKSPVKYGVISKTANNAIQNSIDFYGKEIKYADMPPVETDKSFSQDEATVAKETIKKRTSQIQQNHTNMQAMSAGRE